MSPGRIDGQRVGEVVYRPLTRTARSWPGDRIVVMGMDQTQGTDLLGRLHTHKSPEDDVMSGIGPG